MSVVDESELKNLRTKLKEVIKIKTDELNELLRIFNNAKAIQLDKAGNPPKIIGMIPMSKIMRKEIFDAIKHGVVEHGITPE